MSSSFNEEVRGCQASAHVFRATTYWSEENKEYPKT